MHPLPFPACGDDPSTAEVGEVPGNLRLALAENLDEVADADLAAVHQVEEAQARAVGQRGEERGEIRIRGGVWHGLIIYGLTDMIEKNTFA